MLTIVLCVLIVVAVLLKCLVKFSQFPCQSKVCMVGKTVLITGGSRGLGYETVLDLASRGCRIIVACRSNAEKLRDEIVQKTNNQNVHVKYLDLASFASIRKFAAEIKAEEEKIDVLINNAGLGSAIGLDLTEDGFNALVQTNLIGGFLLTHLLLDLLKKSGNGRIIFLSSVLAFTHQLTLENLKGLEAVGFFEHMYQYGNTKLALIMVSHEFARRLKKYGITSNAIHPGVVLTDIFTNLTTYAFWVKIALCFAKAITVTPVEGAQRTLTLAVSNKYKDITGTFKGFFGLEPKICKNVEFRKKIWAALEEYAQLRPEEKIPEDSATTTLM